MSLNILARASTALSFVGVGRGTGTVAAKPAKKPEKPEADEDPDAAKPPADDKPADKPDDKPDDTAAAAPKDGGGSDGDPDDDDDGGDDDDDEGDPDSDRDEMKDAKKGQRKGKRAARMRERSRIAAIFGHPAAAANVDLAAKLAFTTDIDRAAAGAVLDSLPHVNALADRMAPYATLRPGAGAAAPSGRAQSAASWDAAAVAIGVVGKTAQIVKPSVSDSWDAAIS